jgi:calcium binding protein 39
MPFPFGKSQKSPAEIVKSLKENVAYLEKLDAAESKKCEKVRWYLWTAVLRAR